MKYLCGFIGTGNMGGALVQAAGKVLQPGQAILANREVDRAKELGDRFGFVVGSNEEAARESTYLFLGIKPHLVADVLESLKPVLSARKENPVLVSMAAGVAIDRVQALAGQEYPVIRIMPNTAVSLGQGVVLYEKSRQVTQAQLDGFCRILSAAGKLFPLEESLMDVGAAVSGCGPAYAYLFLDAMADGGVACGLSRQEAVNYAAQTMLGAAQMVLETGKHPDQLKNEVCSPGGSTIQGVRILEQRAVRAAVMDAVIAAWEKNAKLGK